MRSGFLRVLVGGLLLGLLIVSIQHAFPLDELDDAWEQFPWWVALLALPIAFAISLSKAVRFHLLAHTAGVCLPWRTTMRVFMAGQTTTPVPGGEALRAWLLKSESKASTPSVTSTIVAQPVFELMSAVVLVLIGSVIEDDLRIPAVIGLGIFSGLIYLLAHPSLLDRLFSMKWFRLHAPIKKRLHRYLNALRHHFYDPVRESASTHLLARNIGLGLLTHVIGGLLLTLIAWGFGTPIAPWEGVFVYAAGVLIQGLFVFIPGGLGVTEGGMTGLLALLDVPIESALPIVLISRLYTLLLPVTFGALLLLTFYGRRLVINRFRHAL